MLYRVWAIAIVLLAAVALSGCKKEATPPAAPTEAKVTAENLDAELDKLEQQVDADIAAEQ
ncbi:MAG: hypothetical protein L0Y36_06915 [Planctomycetales bacterium]|nr:hypothetical protein [Planctomycetales bacterium]